MAIHRNVAELQRTSEAASINSRYPTNHPGGFSLSIFCNINNPIYPPHEYNDVGISPRSRWSNRDDPSYQSTNSASKSRKNPKSDAWSKPVADSSAAILFVGQLTSLVSLTMLHAGTESTSPESMGGPVSWGLGETSFLVMAIFGLFSFLFLFRVSFSAKAPKRRRRIARIWLLASILASQLT